jgi:hypothetical protein
MRLAHRHSYTMQERETLRWQVFKQLTNGMLEILDLVEDLDDDNMSCAEEIRNARDLRDNEPLPVPLQGALSSLWNDPNVQVIWKDREMYSLPDRCVMFSWNSLRGNDGPFQLVVLLLFLGPPLRCRICANGQRHTAYQLRAPNGQYRRNHIQIRRSGGNHCRRRPLRQRATKVATPIFRCHKYPLRRQLEWVR